MPEKIATEAEEEAFDAALADPVKMKKFLKALGMDEDEKQLPVSDQEDRAKADE